MADPPGANILTSGLCPAISAEGLVHLKHEPPSPLHTHTVALQFTESSVNLVSVDWGHDHLTPGLREGQWKSKSNPGRMELEGEEQIQLSHAPKRAAEEQSRDQTQRGAETRHKGKRQK